MFWPAEATAWESDLCVVFAAAMPTLLMLNDGSGLFRPPRIGEASSAALEVDIVGFDIYVD